MTNYLPSSNVNVPNPYQLGHQQGADTGAIQETRGLDQYNLGGQNIGQYENLTQAGIHNPFTDMFLQGGGQAGAMGMAAGQGAYSAGGQMMGYGLGMLPDVTSLTAMGFDPQQAYYSRAAQQLQDQQRAALAASGVGGTPYGAGVEGQTMGNFNIDWQNTALQRALSGAQGAAGLYGAIGQGVGQGANLQQGGVGEYLQGAGTPYNVFGGINASQLGLLGQAGQYGNQASNIPQQQIQDYLAYLGQGNQNAQTGISAQTLALNRAKLQNQEYQTYGQDIGGAAGWGSGGSSNPFSGFFKPGTFSGGLT
jgi:hypothetical protein